MKGFTKYCAVAALVAGMAGGAFGQGRGPGGIKPGPGDPATIEQADERIRDLQQQAQAAVDRAGLNSTTVNSAYNDLANELDRATIVLKSKEAREQAIQSKIVELTSKARQQIDADEMVKQLRRTAELRQDDALRARDLKQKNLISQEEVDKKAAEAAEALVRVEERKEAITANAGGGSLSALNKELIAVSLDMREQEAIVQLLKERIDRWSRARDYFREIGRLNNVRAYLQQQENPRQSDDGIGFGRNSGGGGRGLTPPPSSARPEGTSPGSSAPSLPSSTQPGR